MKAAVSVAKKSHSTIHVTWEEETENMKHRETFSKKLDAELVEMKRCKSNALCCGAGGAQMFKEPEKGNKDINVERTEEALEEKPDIIATGCPFCMTMMTDGVKHFNRTDNVAVKDIAELLAEAEDL